MQPRDLSLKSNSKIPLPLMHYSSNNLKTSCRRLPNPRNPKPLINPWLLKPQA